MKLELTTEIREKLEEEFRKLNSIEEKFEFWSEKLNVAFCLWPKYEYDTISKFMLKATTAEEAEKINKMSLDQYIERYDFSRKRVYDLDLMKDSFLQQFDSVNNKREFIEYELSILDERIKKREGCISDPFNSSVTFYESGYKKFYFENIEPDLKRVYEVENLISLMNGFALAQYHIFLKGLLNKPVAKDKFTHIQQILVLEYLKIGNHINTSSRKAEFYSNIIRRDTETTRQSLSKINSEKNKKNLSEIYEYFINFNIPEAAQLVKKDIDKLSKKK